MVDTICHFCNSAIDLDSEWGVIRLCENCFRHHSFTMITKLRGDINIGDCTNDCRIRF